MSTLRTLKQLVLGETWLLPLGIAAVIAAAGLLIRPLASSAWEQLGGFILLAGVVAVLLTSVARAAHPRPRPRGERATGPPATAPTHERRY